MNMSAPGNAAKLGTALSNIQTAQIWSFLVGIEHTIPISINQHTIESAHYSNMPVHITFLLFFLPSSVAI